MSLVNLSSTKVFISPNGSADNPGTESEPLLTLKAARNKLRNVSGSKKVILRGGTYQLDRTFVLIQEDSNTEYEAYPGESPVISGARVIKGWHTLETNRPEISAKAKGKLWVAEIPSGWRFHYLYINGQRAERSKSTNSFWRDWPKDHKVGKPDEKGQLVKFKRKTNLKYIPSNGDAEMVCIMAQYGVMGNGVILDVNPKARTLRWNSKSLNLSKSRNKKERGYRFENALCFIDTPGEWAVDTAEGRVYYWPKQDEDMTKAKVVAPKLNELVRLQGNEAEGSIVKHVVFEGLTFAYTDRLPENEWPPHWLCRQWENVDATLYFSGTEDCTLQNCRILQSGAYGITINHHGQRNCIENCEIGWTGSGGIFLEGYGPGTLDVNKDNIITRNYIHDHGLGNYWHSPSIQIYQSGKNTINYNMLQRSAYSSISTTGMHPIYMNDPELFFPGTYLGQWHSWNHFCVRSKDFPPEIQEGVKKQTYQFDRETMKPYMHSGENLIEYNVISEPHSKLNEGGAIYAWCLGKGNVWRKNVIFKSRGMPGSSILALDDVAEYTTITDNVFWIEGEILDGVGAREDERGNIISGNVRVNYKLKYDAKRGHAYLGIWSTNIEGREPLDALLKEITDIVQEQGGWPSNPPIGIPKLGGELTHYGEQLILPKGSNVTIE